ncbi:ABC transporter ATP-binding protein [Ferrimonas kyonanensis]|uniref:ABC transporter ATP-binding protein n=1 Tax=Ferrimonas kyonanensis TaxID=364763 RepID=UPI00041E6377|nr:ABC transporter ATP-binding protein [Ferrimonas kyonanensis]
MSTLIHAQALSKRYGDKLAVDHIDLAIEQGSCFGLLGPNGAGKSTTLEMLEGITPPDSGTILFNGQPLSRAYQHAIGIQFQSTALPDYLSVRDCLKLFASFYPKPVALEPLLEQCQLTEVADQLHFHLSGGQRQRLLLAMSLVNDPQLLFLDEPTTGLDPNARQAFWALLQKVKAQGKTILMTTHYMEEAEQLCDRIAIMDRGQIIAEQSPLALIEDHFFPHLVSLPSDRRLPEPPAAEIRVHRQGPQLLLECRDTDGVLKWLSGAGVSLQGLNIRQPNLEDLFLKLTGSTLQS